MKEYSVHNTLRNARELFNHQHSPLRDAAKRANGILRKCFPILRSGREPTYYIQTHKLIVIACYILHNYLLGADLDEDRIAEVDKEVDNQPIEHVIANPHVDYNENAMVGALDRDSLTNDMW